MTGKHPTDELLAQICAAPRDDVPRNVYADLLEERGDERGQLIQLQLKRALLPAWDPQVTELELHERALLARHDAAWRTELPSLPGVTWGSFTRGFVGTVAFDSLDAFAAHRDTCLAAAPVHSIVIRWSRTSGAPRLDAIASVDELTLVGTVMDKADLKWLAASPLLATLRSLSLIDSEIRVGLPELLKSKYLAKLAALRIPLHQIGNAGVAKLTAAPLPSLMELDLSVGTGAEERSSYSRTPAATVGNRAALALAAWAHLAQIASLDVSGASFGREGLTALLASPYATGIKRLYVRDIADAKWDMDDSLAAFQPGPGGLLDELDVSNNDLDGEAAAALMQSRALQQLKILSLDHVRSRHFDRVAQAPWIHSLRILSCGESALEPIVKRAPRQLHTIRVVADGAASQGVAKKLAAVPLPALTRLDLSASRIDDSSLRVLGGVDTLPNLVSVTLAAGPETSAAFTPAGAAEFAGSPLGKRLQCLHVGIAELDRLPPRPAIDFGDGEYAGPWRFL